MKNLILVRHGEYDKISGDLNQSGFYQMELISEKLKNNLVGSIGIFSSGVSRADQSAEILRKTLCPKGSGNILKILDYQSVDLNGRNFNKIRRSGKKMLSIFDNVLFVTHIGVVSDFPGMFAQKEWRQNKKRTIVSKGSAVLLNMEEKRYEIINPK